LHFTVRNHLYNPSYITKKHNGKNMNRVRNLLDWDFVRQKGYTGDGVGVAVFDTGIFPHPDLKHRIIGMKDFVEDSYGIYDDNGHGTHVAGILAGDGSSSEGKYTGIAPGAWLYAYKILNEGGNGNLNRAVQALEDCISRAKAYNLRILNFSMGMGKNVNSEEKKRLLNCLEMAWDAGIVVVCAAGNEGPLPMSITPPGNLRKIITVGAMDDESSNVPGNLNRGYSGRGPTGSYIMKPEVVAPGTNITSCNAKRKPLYTIKSGTSMSTPVVSGAIALLLEKYPNLTPAQVKLRLYHTCVSMGLKKNHEGWGMLNLKNLLTGSL